MIPSNSRDFLNAWMIYGTISGVAKALNVSNGTARKMLITLGVYSSPRSREIANLLDKGLTYAEIQKQLGIAENTVVANAPYMQNSYLNPDKSENAIHLSKWGATKKLRRQGTDFTLEELSASLDEYGELDFGHNAFLTHLPEGVITVGGDLKLAGCTALAELPQGLHVGGNLRLVGCTALTELPQGLYVGGNLILRNCSNLSELPQDLKVGGMLDLRGCSSLEEFPDWLKEESAEWKYTLRNLRDITAPNIDGISWKRYHYKVLRARVRYNPSIENINNLIDWCVRYKQHWNGECYSCDGLELWPIYSKPDKNGHRYILGYEVKYSEI